MADQKRWFKVWTTIALDPTFLSLPVEVIGRWTLLGAWIAAHGDKGRIVASNEAIRHALRIGSRAVKDALFELPHVTYEEGINDNGDFAVIMVNWSKYQLDATGYERLKRHRNKPNDNGLREEKTKRRLREEKKEPPIVPQGTTVGFDQFWSAYPKKVGKGAARKSWEKLHPSQALTAVILLAVQSQRTSHDWTKDGGQYIPNPATWLNQTRWEDGTPGNGNGTDNTTQVDPRSRWKSQESYLIAVRVGAVARKDRIPEWETPSIPT